MKLTQEWLAQLPLTGIEEVRPVNGGDINQAYKISTSTSRYFLKVQPENNANFFKHEINGLQNLAKVVVTPKVIASGTIENAGYLILAWLDFKTGNDAELGRAVASVHRLTAPQFGLENNFTEGMLPKINTWQANWADFYVNQRLEPLVRLAKQKRLWNTQRERLVKHLEEIIYQDSRTRKITPSLLHGDLWRGNVAFLKDGRPVLIDPDIFYGDREMDLAMTKLFGGFSADFYTAYNTAFPLPENYQKRMAWYQVYYLLAHLNLFGERYGSSLDTVLIEAVK
ncbi:fructosamine kinase family protein [Loigolactobacillus iwatensis]|uniref:fructosamine kinase family protein n=1 Tax=Loigolactobacillus iwatensis TaxID=1267156 RepID=UPI000F7E80A4|nr:fructosamine kinase family protein [Loigolactobacillus iwatensis]